MKTDLKNCRICPRKCGADRTAGTGYCGASEEIEVSKIMLHHWEEPPISGYHSEYRKNGEENRGSGAIFLTHCPLGCVYCQNSKISRRSSSGKKYTPAELADEMLQLERDGAYNINLVSPTQYTPQLVESVKIARNNGLTLPIVWNTGGYELPETIRQLRGTVDIFLTDFKYAGESLSLSLSNAKDYPNTAIAALREMYSAAGDVELDENGMMRRGVIVRHLVLPSYRKDSINALSMIKEAVPTDKILLSLMAQYTPEFLPPANNPDRFKEIRRKITTFEYNKVRDEAIRLGFDGFMQERSSAVKKFTPDF